MKNKFKLERPICFLDLEATGLNVIRDRIVQIGIIKFHPGEEEAETLDMLINPGIPISQEAIDVHGITPQDVISAPTFAQAAEKIDRFIKDADIAGYNSNRFDIPMLMEEMHRAGYELEVENRKLIDVQRIFHKMEPRTLEAAHKYYTGKEMEGAHDALSDVKATAAVLLGQIEKYADSDYEDSDGKVQERPIKNDMSALHAFTNDSQVIDVTRKVKYDADGNIVFNFGKHRGKKVGETLLQDENYYHWILDKEFSIQVKRLVKQEYEKAKKDSSSHD